MRPTNTVSPRIHLPIHHWRTNRDCSSKLLTRHCPTRHILRGSPLPLRTINGSSIRNPSRIHPLIPTIHWLHSTLNMSQNTLWGNIRGSKPNLLPPTLPRPSRNATTILRLPRRLHTMKHYLISRIVNLSDSRNYASVHHLRSLRIKTQSPTTRTNKHQR